MLPSPRQTFALSLRRKHDNLLVLRRIRCRINTKYPSISRQDSLLFDLTKFTGIREPGKNRVHRNSPDVNACETDFENSRTEFHYQYEMQFVARPVIHFSDEIPDMITRFLPKLIERLYEIYVLSPQHFKSIAESLDESPDRIARIFVEIRRRDIFLACRLKQFIGLV